MISILVGETFLHAPLDVDARARVETRTHYDRHVQCPVCGGVADVRPTRRLTTA